MYEDINLDREEAAIQQASNPLDEQRRWDAAVAAVEEAQDAYLAWWLSVQ